jgi:predicted acetyltransferase
MSLTLRWVGEDERTRVGEVRGLCYGRSRKELADFVEQIRGDRRSGPGDWLLAERDGVAVGTATALAMTMWVRGGAVPCQGVAFVGTVKTHRRRSGEEKGVGTAVMREVLRMARGRKQVVSALMPFRGSWYEHFGYGIVERRTDWTVPLSILPAGDFETVRFYDAGRDKQPLIECRQRLAQRGQADIERSPAAWDAYIEDVERHGFLVVDRHGDGPVRGWMGFDNVHDSKAGTDTVRAQFDTGFEDMATFKRFLHFLQSLRDQYSFASLRLSHDLPLNLLLKEPQMTHRLNRNHPTAEMRPYTRMQVRVLDHARLLEAMKLPADRAAGKVVVAIRETDGTVT